MVAMMLAQNWLTLTQLFTTRFGLNVKCMHKTDYKNVGKYKFKLVAIMAAKMTAQNFE